MGVMDGILEIVGLRKAPEVLIPPDQSEERKRHEELWAKDTAARKPLEEQWQLNISMVHGNQWCGWNGQTVVPLQAPSWRIQAVDNKLFVRARAKMTRLLMDMQPQFLPETSDYRDVRRTKYKERVLNHALREIQIEQIKARAAQWVVVCGEAWTEAYWNESAGETYADDSGVFSEGEVGIKVRGPFEVWPAAGASIGNPGGRLWTADIVPVELARLKWANKEIAPDAADVSDAQLRAQLDTYFQIGASRMNSYGDPRKNLEECVLVKTLREYRTPANPQGRITTIINGKVVAQEPLLWDGITHITNFPSFSSYHGDAVEMRLSIQPQKSINRLESNWEEYVRLLAKGKILAHKSLNIKSNQFDSEHGEVVTYDGAGQAPQPWMPPPMPSDTKELIGLRQATIDDIWSDHMASQGRSPASASGAAINYLIEADQEQHTLTRDLWVRGWERTYEKVMDVIAGASGRGGYDETRMIAVLGEDRRSDVQPADMEMLGGKNRCRIIVSSALPQNKTLKAEVVRRWFTDGALGDPTQKEARRKFMKLTDAGLADDIWDDEALDEIRQEKENELLAAGIGVAPRPEDGHDVHIWTLKHWMKTDEFLRLPIEVQELAYDHLAVHENAAQNPMALLAALQAQKAARGGAPGGPSKPLPGPASSPAVENPANLMKSVEQAGEAPPPLGAPNPPNPTAKE